MGPLILSTLALTGLATASVLNIMPEHPNSEVDDLFSRMNDVLSSKFLPPSRTAKGSTTTTTERLTIIGGTDPASTTMGRVAVPVTSPTVARTLETTSSKREHEAITTTITIMQSAFPKQKHYDATEIVIESAPGFTSQTATTRHASELAPTQLFTSSSAAAIAQHSAMTTMSTRTLPSSKSSLSISAVRETPSPGSYPCIMPATEAVLKESIARLEDLVAYMESGDKQLEHQIFDNMSNLFRAAIDVCPTVPMLGHGGDGKETHDAVLQRAKASISTMKEELSMCHKAWDVMCGVVKVFQDLKEASHKGK